MVGSRSINAFIGAGVLVLLLACLLRCTQFGYIQEPKPCHATAKESETAVASDLHDEGVTVAFHNCDGEFYDFSGTSMYGGGVELLVVQKPEKTFSIIWQGQDAPPCEVVERYGVPSTIAPLCLRTLTVDRRNSPIPVFVAN